MNKLSVFVNYKYVNEHNYSLVMLVYILIVHKHVFKLINVQTNLEVSRTSDTLKPPSHNYHPHATRYIVEHHQSPLGFFNNN